MRKFATAVALGALLLGPVAAHADVLYTYSLSNALFDDGTAATGTFTIDSTAASVTAWNIVTQTNGPLSGQTYTTASSQPYFSSGALQFSQNDYSYYIQFVLTSAEYSDLLAGASSVEFEAATSYECNDCGNVRTFTQGSFALSDVPEPSALAVVLSAVGMMGLARYAGGRRRA